MSPTYHAETARLTDPWSTYATDFWLAGVWDQDGQLVWSSEPESFGSDAQALAAAEQKIRDLQHVASALPLERGAAITALREQLGMSQGALARALEVNPSSVSRWEREGAPLLALLATQALTRRPRSRRRTA
jgi:DNA-binding transcriptional regulator YiaG